MALKRIVLSDTTAEQNRIAHVAAVEGIFEGLYNAIKKGKSDNKRKEFDRTAKNENHAWSITYSEENFNKTIESLKEIITDNYLSDDFKIAKGGKGRLDDKSNWIAYDGKVVPPDVGRFKLTELLGVMNGVITQAMPNISYRQKVIRDIERLNTQEAVDTYLSDATFNKKLSSGISANARPREVRGVPGSSGPWFPAGWSDRDRANTPLALFESSGKAAPAIVMMNEEQAKQFSKNLIEYLDFAKEAFSKINKDIKKTKIADWDEVELADGVDVNDTGDESWLFTDNQHRLEVSTVLFDIRTLLAYTVMGYYRYLVNAAPV